MLVSVLTTPVFAAQATVSIDPTHGRPGTGITLSGSGFPPESVVAIGFGSLSLMYTTTSAAGAFIAYFGAPTDPPGNYSVSATLGKYTASANFTIDSLTGTTTSTSTSTSTATPKTSTVTTTSTSTTTTTETSTTTAFLTVTTTPPAVTFTATRNYTTTAPQASPVTTTATVTQPPTSVTVTLLASQSTTGPGTGQTSPQASIGFSDASLYFLAGVGILVTAIGVGMLAMRSRAMEGYRREAAGRGNAT